MATGRPRGFDTDAALGRALEVFWRRGFEGATLEELTAAMGVSRPSLYAAFGDKESLFRKALDRYESGFAERSSAALAEPTARAVAGHVLATVVEGLGDPDRPRGCLIVQAALTCGPGSERVRAELAARREAWVATLRARFERAVAEGDLPPDADAAALARLLATVAHGLSVQAAGGADPDELRRAAALALRAWPA